MKRRTNAQIAADRAAYSQRSDDALEAMQALEKAMGWQASNDNPHGIYFEDGYVSVRAESMLRVVARLNGLPAPKDEVENIATKLGNLAAALRAMVQGASR